MNRKSITILTILLISLVLLGCNKQTPTKSTLDTNNSSNSKIIATVGNTNITEPQFEKKKQLLKQNWEKMNKPQSDGFYNKAALYTLITSSLVDTEVKKTGVTVSREDAIDYLNKIVNEIESLSENDPSRVQFMDVVKTSGFQNTKDYVNSDQVISATQKALAISKMLAGSGQGYQQLVDKLLAQNNYKILVPIDITGYQEELKTIDMTPVSPPTSGNTTNAITIKSDK